MLLHPRPPQSGSAHSRVRAFHRPAPPIIPLAPPSTAATAPPPPLRPSLHRIPNPLPYILRRMIEVQSLSPQEGSPSPTSDSPQSVHQIPHNTPIYTLLNPSPHVLPLCQRIRTVGVRHHSPRPLTHYPSADKPASIALLQHSRGTHRLRHPLDPLRRRRLPIISVNTSCTRSNTINVPRNVNFCPIHPVLFHPQLLAPRPLSTDFPLPSTRIHPVSTPLRLRYVLLHPPPHHHPQHPLR